MFGRHVGGDSHHTAFFNPVKAEIERGFIAPVDGGNDPEPFGCPVSAAPTITKYIPRIDQARQTLLEEKYRKQFRELAVTYIWGRTGVGKTRGVMERYGYENVYRVTNYNHPFDGYSGEPVILFDEFRSSLPITDMLKYLDGYPVSLPARYGDRVACFTEVYVVSNIPMGKQYPHIQVEEPETWAAFLRRFQRVYELQAADGDTPF